MKKHKTRGKNLLIKNLIKKKSGDHIWIFWCKDDNPEYERINEVVEILEIHSKDNGKWEVITSSGEYDIDCDTDLKDNCIDFAGRGYAYFFEVNG